MWIVFLRALVECHSFISCFVAHCLSHSSSLSPFSSFCFTPLVAQNTCWMSKNLHSALQGGLLFGRLGRAEPSQKIWAQGPPWSQQLAHGKQNPFEKGQFSHTLQRSRDHGGFNWNNLHNISGTADFTTVLSRARTKMLSSARAESDSRVFERLNAGFFQIRRQLQSQTM